ncbi:LysR substrate-binding domain-containing protein [Methylobacterium sp. J-070]|uniref:LysR substrate-binding domain-containing protein n=1 Tax=Methylobacterium sp. J-070 TaxID=2836650 RepID=UPI001FBB3DAF|nr:LysR substrate-binding domain-containing protein [Methylobacterium sp. J-070]MCJ2049982.1 LysR substrate-binding domain-containing protein [Methylobacterium sp. J-070]
MIDTEDLRFFAVVAASPSLAAAARALNVSPPAVTQRLRALEKRLRVHLMDRSGRGLTLTDEGELLAEHGRDLLAAFDDLDNALAERRGEVIGHLRVVAPFGFGRRHVAPVVAAFRILHPGVRVDLLLSDRLGRMPSEMWDLAIHVGEIKEATPSLTVRLLAPNDRVLCAAPAYLAQRPAPLTPAELKDHVCIALRENDEDVTLWRLCSTDGTEERVRIEADLTSNDGEVVRGWALAGLGVIVRSEWDVADDLRTRRLIRVLEGYALPPAPVVALLGSNRRARAARTERFLAALRQSLDPLPWREHRHLAGMAQADRHST